MSCTSRVFYVKVCTFLGSLAVNAIVRLYECLMSLLSQHQRDKKQFLVLTYLLHKHIAFCKTLDFFARFWVSLVVFSPKYRVIIFVEL